MRSVFPALHDRLLSTLLLGALFLLLIAILAVSMRQPAEAAEPQVEVPPLFISGATPAQ